MRLDEVPPVAWCHPSPDFLRCAAVLAVPGEVPELMAAKALQGETASRDPVVVREAVEAPITHGVWDVPPPWSFWCARPGLLGLLGLMGQDLPPTSCFGQRDLAVPSRWSSGPKALVDRDTLRACVPAWCHPSSELQMGGDPLGAGAPQMVTALTPGRPAGTPPPSSPFGGWTGIHLHGCGLRRLLFYDTGVWKGTRTRQIRDIPCRRAPVDDIAVGGWLLGGGVEIGVVVGTIGDLPPPHGLGAAGGLAWEEGGGVWGKGGGAFTF